MLPILPAKYSNNRCELTYRESVFLACGLRLGFSHFLCIDSLSLTWYLVAAKSARIWKQSTEQDSRHWERLWTQQLLVNVRITIFPKSRTRLEIYHALAWRSVGWFHIHNKRYTMHCEEPFRDDIFHAKQICVLRLWLHLSVICTYSLTKSS